jgi:putative tricarboxylic transport membrane protein
MNKKTFSLGVFSILLGIIMLIMSNGIKDFAAVGVGAKFFPRIAATGFIIIGALLAFQQRAVVSQLFSSSGTKAAKEDAGDMVAVWLTMGLLAIYLFLVPRLGYILSTLIYIFGQTLILNRGEKQHYLRFALIALISASATYLLFVKVFRVMIPAGIFG